MNREIMCAGSVALDSTRTPFGSVTDALGGAAAYFSYAASFFAPVHVVSVVGDDFPSSHQSFLERKEGMDTQGIQRIAGGKSFRYASEFSYDLHQRTTLSTELNVLAEFHPRVPSDAQSCSHVYLATMPPEKQLAALSQMTNPQLVFADTIEFFIEHERQGLLRLLSSLDGLVINDAEARKLTDTHSLLRAGKSLQSLGPRMVVIKKGEEGCLLFFERHVFPFPAFPLEDVQDPTGAGDAFAGGMVGYLAREGVGRENASVNQLRMAVAFGTVMGSFAVEGFGLDKLSRISIDEIGARLQEYRNLLAL